MAREFKLEALRLVLEEGRSVTVVARELGIGRESLCRWKHEFLSDPNQSFPGGGKLKDREEEVEALRRELARLKSENAFLKKVSAYFAKTPR